MADNSYRIKYRLSDFEIEIQGDKVWVEEKFQELTKSKINVPSKTTATDKNATKIPVNSNISVVEFLRSKGNPKSHATRILIFAYWLHHFKKIESYDASDIENCYSEARITPPKNITDSMNKIQAKGYLMTAPEKDGKKTWVVTQSGEEFLKDLK